jgi:hypothetical protein
LRSGCWSALAALTLLLGVDAAYAQGAPVAEEADEPLPEEPIPPAYTQPAGPPPPGAPPPPDPYNYGVPPGTPMAYDIDDWEEGDPIPPGYRPDTRIRKGLVIGGAVTLGAVWLVFGVLPASIMVAVEETDEADFSNDTGEDKEDYYPLYIPVAGPFVTIFTTESQAAGTALLIIDGVAQTAGLAMLIAGLAAQKTVLEPDPTYRAAEWHVAPIVTPELTGLGAFGTF